jgi:hypothetical protein
MNIKNTKEIFHFYPTVCYAGVEYNYNDLKNCNVLSDKKWVAVDDIVKHFRGCERDPEGSIILLLEEIDPIENKGD